MMALDFDSSAFLLALIMTSAVVIIGVILFASLLGRSSVSETLRDLYRTYFGGDDDLPSGGELNAKIDPKSYTDPADKASADAAKNEDEAPRLNEPAPKYLWRLVLGICCGLVLIIVLSAITLGLRFADPPRAEHLMYDYRADQDPFRANDPASPILTFPENIQSQTFTIEISALLHPESDFYAAWGVWLESAEDYRLILISWTGYVTALSCPTLTMTLDDCSLPQDAATQWRYFHFLRPLGEVNQIYLHYDPERPNILSLRLNREWMWDVPYTLPDQGLSWGVWGGSAYWGFERLRLWAN